MNGQAERYHHAGRDSERARSEDDRHIGGNGRLDIADAFLDVWWWPARCSCAHSAVMPVSRDRQLAGMVKLLTQVERETPKTSCKQQNARRIAALSKTVDQGSRDS